MLSGIVHNLCDNAIKYNRPGGTVNIDVSSADGEAVLTVTDTGIGIPEQAQDRIFERFYRVDKSRSKAVGGTGLGLSIVKHAVKLHGGEITVNSSVGRGTKVTVRLPVKENRNPDPVTSADAGTVSTANNVSTSGNSTTADSRPEGI